MITSIIVALPLSLNTLALIKWRNREGRERTFRLADKVSSKWRDLGLRLSIEPAILDGWENQYQRDASRCWGKVMGEFITRGGTGDYPSTWEGVYQLLKDIKCGGIARDLKEAVTHANTGDYDPPQVEPSAHKKFTLSQCDYFNILRGLLS